ncbi:MAG: hypothetical protein OXG52_07695, partial [bacterium]|nr:hypothetical protein [bacterium]
GGLGLRRLRPPRHPTARVTFAAACSAWSVMIAVSTAAYLAAGATASLPDAVLESISGFCTTGISVLEGLESLPAGVLLWRAITQWLGGLAALILLAAALPQHAPGLVLPGDGGAVPGRSSIPDFGTQVRRLATVYGAVTLVCAAAYAAAGMGALDAFSYAFTTVSTGGFGNHADGLGHFDSAAVEAVATIFMAIAGISAMTLWWVVRGRFEVLSRSFEFRTYALVLGAGIAALTAWTYSGAGAADLRRGAFAAAASMSSTGFEAPGWSGWPWGAQVLAVALIATGAMAATAGGGFQMPRAIAAARYAYRELVVEIHPQTVHVVKIGRHSVSERSLALLNGYQILFAVAMVGGAFTLSLAGRGLWEAAAASVSALATMGPAPGVDLGALGGLERGVLAALMLLGRLALYPLVVAAVGVAAGARRRVAADRADGRRTVR